MARPLWRSRSSICLLIFLPPLQPSSRGKASRECIVQVDLCACCLDRRRVAGTVLTHSLVAQRYRIPGASVHAQIKDVEPIIVADDVMHLLRLYASRQIDLRVDDAFVVDQWRADEPTIWPNHAGKSATLAFKLGPCVRHDLLHRGDYFRRNGRRRYDGEQLALE